MAGDLMTYRFPDGSKIEGMRSGDKIEDVLNELDAYGQDTSHFRAQLEIQRQKEMPAPMRWAEGTKEGLRRWLPGMQQAGMAVGEKLGMVDPAQLQKFTQDEMQRQQQFDQNFPGNTTAGKAGVLTGQIGPAMAIPPVAGTGMGALAANAGIGAAIGASQFVPEGESRMQNAMIGGGVPVGMNMLARGGAKVAQMFGRNVAPAAEEVIAAGDRANVPVYAPDIGGPMTQKAGTMLENVTSGMVPARIRQANAADEATKALAQRLSTQANRAQGEMNPILTAEVSRGGPHEGIARQGMEAMKATADDWGLAMKGSVIRKTAGNKIISTRNFDNVARLADGIPPMESKSIDSGMQKILSEIQSNPVPGPEQKFFSELNGGLQQYRDPNTGTLSLDFNSMRQIRQAITAAKKDYYSGSRNLVGDRGVQYLESLQKMVDQDMDAFATAAGSKVKSSYDFANKFYKENVIPFTDPQLTAAVANKKWDEAFQYFMKGGEERAKIVYNNMDVRGKAMMRYGLIQTAQEKATGSKGLSLAKFATQLEKMSDASNVIFKDSGEDIKGMTKLMRHIERASQIREDPPTGNRLVGWLLAGYGLQGSPWTAAGVFAGSQATRAALTSQTVRNALFAASRLKPGSKEMDVLLNSLIKKSQRAAFGAAAAQ